MGRGYGFRSALMNGRRQRRMADLKRARSGHVSLASVPLMLLHEGKDSLIVGVWVLPWNSMRACSDLNSLAIGQATV